MIDLGLVKYGGRWRHWGEVLNPAQVGK